MIEWNHLLEFHYQLKKKTNPVLLPACQCGRILNIIHPTTDVKRKDVLRLHHHSYLMPQLCQKKNCCFERYKCFIRGVNRKRLQIPNNKRDKIELRPQVLKFIASWKPLLKHTFDCKLSLQPPKESKALSFWMQINTRTGPQDVQQPFMWIARDTIKAVVDRKYNYLLNLKVQGVQFNKLAQMVVSDHHGGEYLGLDHYLEHYLHCYINIHMYRRTTHLCNKPQYTKLLSVLSIPFDLVNLIVLYLGDMYVSPRVRYNTWYYPRFGRTPSSNLAYDLGTLYGYEPDYLLSFDDLLTLVSKEYVPLSRQSKSDNVKTIQLNLFLYDITYGTTLLAFLEEQISILGQLIDGGWYTFDDTLKTVLYWQKYWYKKQPYP